MIVVDLLSSLGWLCKPRRAAIPLLLMIGLTLVPALAPLAMPAQETSTSTERAPRSPSTNGNCPGRNTGSLISRVQYHGVQPIWPLPPSSFIKINSRQNMAPLPPSKQNLPEVDSLQPTLCWEPADQATQFDLIVWTGLMAGGSSAFCNLGCNWYVKGVEVYYREGIQDNRQRIEQPLRAGTVYVWSVRTRSSNNLGQWSTYDFERGLIPVKGLAQSWGTNHLWVFRTPQ